MISSILNMREIGKTIKKAVYIPPIQVEAIFEGEATSPTNKMIIKPCNERLMTWWSNSIEHNRSDPLPASMSLPMIKRTLFTDRGQELYQANPSPISVHTTHTSGSRFWRRSHIYHGGNDNKAIQREIEDLKKLIHWAQQKRSPSSSDVSSND